MTTPRPPRPPRSPILRDKNFRWLLSGGVISGFGDQFTMIALPWLVLTMTGDPLALGAVIAIMSVPRAVFMLVGGALVDRYSPRRVLMLTKYANAALLAALAWLVLCAPALLSLPLLYALALGLGLAQAFSIPSGTSIMPQVVPPEHLQAANGAMMGMRQLTMLAGPVLAALLIALAGDGGAASHGPAASAGIAAHGNAASAGAGGPAAGAALHAPAGALGIGLAFAFDCFTFLFTAWTLAQVRMREGAAAPAGPPQSIFASVAEGLLTVWRDVALRTCFIYWSVVAVFVGGAMQVALPLLASRNLHGAASLGVLTGAHGTGMLLGMALSSAGISLRLGGFGATLLAIDAIVALLLAPLGAISATWQGAALLLLAGTLAGFMQIAVFTWIQGSVPPRMLGRAMSIFMFIFMGLAPLSAAAIGALLKVVSLAQLFAGGSVLLLAVSGLAWALTPMAAIGADGGLRAKR
ncbi:MFS transporter [Massilia sp. Root418]|jgi:MFS family permease|uniref:MFS transporter n=1 Tax=Massilia sp. Root418 TaxID=1736532 RepID=UPI0006F5D157|nr:MFS transporter [Massilia sp. Root418]KQW87172.1 MFS transporter [Massilia sp. Root418]